MTCISQYCGETSTGEYCAKCQHRPALDEFKAWVKLTGAIPLDPIWTPLIYEVKNDTQK